LSKVKLGDIADVELGKMLDAEKNKGKPHPYLANANVRWGSFDLDNLPMMPFKDSEKERYLLRRGDLVMCEGGEPGRCAIWKGELPDVRYQKALHRIRPHDNVDVRWLYYWFLLQGRIGGLEKYITQTTIKHLVREDLKQVEIDLPSLDEERHIADVLAAIDDKIENNCKIMAELEATARLVYDEWFVRFDFPDENGRPYRSSGGAMVWNDKLKHEIPAAWKCGTIGELGHIISGATPSTVEMANYVDGNVAWITPNDLADKGGGPFLWHGERDITERGLASCSAMLMPPGSVIMSSRAPIGYLAIAANECCTNQGCKSLVVDKGFGTSFVFLTLLRNMPLIESQGAGTTFKEISGSTLASINIAIPPVSVANSFESKMNSLLGSLKVIQMDSMRLQSLRDWLLPILMNGQVRIE
jgi:type I restriction enzyme S subunit